MQAPVESSSTWGNMPVRMLRLHLAHLCFLAYSGASVYAAIWVSDEFDPLRMQLYSFVLTPLTIFWFYLCGFPRYAAKWKLALDKRAWVTMLMLCVFHSWGAFLGMNALTGNNRPVVYTRLTQSRVAQRSMAVAYRRGGLGWLFRTRW
ncbi:MAG: hypothetical protein OXT67_04685 [Zetaproteobacteria bacterium]|nr:hypothetical protein [Zetaproteobacteria bacterium]